MAFYLVSARFKPDLIDELRTKLFNDDFEKLQPFGRALTHSLKNARITIENLILWEEEDYCNPPLFHERTAVLDNYFEIIEIKRIGKDEGWKKINSLPHLFLTH